MKKDLLFLKNLVRQSGGQRVLADGSGYSRSYVAMVVNGHRKPSTAFRLFCEKKFGLPAAILFDENQRSK